MTIQPGWVLQGRYRVLQQLGKGGSSQTFDVDDQGTHRVLKVLDLRRFFEEQAQQKAISLFKREAEVLQRLRLPGVPRVEADGYFIHSDNSTGEEIAYHCLIMEKINGSNLEQWLENRGNQPLSEPQAIAWLRQLVEILGQLHQADLIHRDIKPANIMLRPETQRLVLIDFGGVREVTNTYLQYQQTGTVLISRGYTPPEQLEGRAVRQSDFFALGRTFVYLLTGRPPYELQLDNRTDRLLWRDYAPQVSKMLAGLIDYLIDRAPGRRPQNTQEILRCIEEIVSPDRPSSDSNPLRDRPSPLFSTDSSPPTNGRRRESGNVPQTNRTPPLPPWSKADLSFTLTGHTQFISSLSLSPDNNTLVSGSHDHSICLWSLRDRTLITILKGHQDRVTCLSISPDGLWLVSGSYDRTIKLWFLREGTLKGTLPRQVQPGLLNRIHSLRFVDGQTVVSVSGEDILLWNVFSGAVQRLDLKEFSGVRVIALSPSRRTLASGSLQGGLKLWNLHTRQLMWNFPIQEGSVVDLAFSGDGRLLASSIGRLAVLWDVSSGRLLQPFPHASGRSRAVALSPDGQVLASGGEQTIELWNLTNYEQLCVLSGHTKPIRTLRFSSTGDTLISGSEDGTIKVWQPQDLQSSTL